MARHHHQTRARHPWHPRHTHAEGASPPPSPRRVRTGGAGRRARNPVAAIRGTAMHKHAPGSRAVPVVAAGARAARHIRNGRGRRERGDLGGRLFVRLCLVDLAILLARVASRRRTTSSASSRSAVPAAIPIPAVLRASTVPIVPTPPRLLLLRTRLHIQ